MLTNTFLHFPGIGPKKEQSLWKEGILTWDDYERKALQQPSLFADSTESGSLQTLAESRKALRDRNFDYFAELLPNSEQYRIALADPDRVVFLDIEATGLSLYYDQTTIIGAGTKKRYYVYIKGDNLEQIESLLNEASCIVTFNGSLFDLKFIRKEFPSLRVPKAHVDLRFFGLKFGLRGSQKEIEKDTGFVRPYEIRNILGETAPLLWHRFTVGDREAGKQLIQYNHSDIEGMKFIFDLALQKVVKSRGLLKVKEPKFYQGPRLLPWSRKPVEGHSSRIYIRPFTGRVGARITYDELVGAENFGNIRIVGIDLTGSEKRPTGWCLLEGKQAITKVLSTDNELIAQTVATKPRIVSIDSPLSLPKGRIRVTNDDPGRQIYGIMRECERTLKKRGVNVYPSLIDSMQNLTARGIRLAQAFRQQGIPVIESYPGAAQDIMGIPRKGAGLDYSKQGLSEFGITGSFLTEKVVHDEVDAVVSAVVGLFFWSGKFEALGNDDEDYLIIPDLLIDPVHWRTRRVIALSGAISAGKTEGSKFLERSGFMYGRYSQVLKDMLLERGLKPTRERLQELGDQVHHNPGQRWLSRQLVRRLSARADLAIDGIRFPEDHAFLTESFGPAFLHVHVDASEEVRRARYIKDGRPSEEFDEAIHHQVEAQVPQLAAYAHATIVNEGSPSEFFGHLGQIGEDRNLERLAVPAQSQTQIEDGSAGSSPSRVS